MKLSAIIPVGNYWGDRDFLLKTLELTNKFEVETIIVLDSQNEDAYSDLQRHIHAMGGGNRSIVRSTCGNPGESRNQGLLRASAEWVMFWDCDDRPNVEQIRNTLDLYSDNENIDAIIGQFSKTWISNDGSAFLKQEVNQCHDLREVAIEPGIWRWIFRRNRKFSEINFPNLNMGEDQAFLYKYLSSNPSIVIDDTIVYDYCINEGTKQLTTQSKSSVLSFLALKEVLKINNSSIVPRHQTELNIIVLNLMQSSVRYRSKDYDFNTMVMNALLILRRKKIMRDVFVFFTLKFKASRR